ncbi:MAG: hypothetical protein IT349_02715 [Candidatus Eisenbacteria bacterium]|nr:hypothetical protein [Candidatus Eisenbacteria bacterium]
MGRRGLIARAALSLLLLIFGVAEAGAQLVLTAGRPDQVRIDGVGPNPELRARAFRWRGLDLKTVDQQVGNATLPAVQGRCIRVEIGLAPGEYEVETDLLAGAAEWIVNDASAGRVEPAGGIGTLRGAANVPFGGMPLTLIWKADVGAVTAVREVRIRRPDGQPVELQGLLPIVTPQAALQQPHEEIPPKEALRRTCDYLVRYQLSNGFFDYESAALWEVGLVTRCLFLGAELLHEPRYAEAARRPLAFLVAQQAPDGGFCAYAYSTLSGRIPAPTDSCHTRNIADLSFLSIAFSLAARAKVEGGPALLEAHRRFLDDFADRLALPDGRFLNGRFHGQTKETAYSVATATQVVSRLSFYRAASEIRFRESAEPAARALVREWQPSGRPLFSEHGEAPAPLRPTAYHNLFYVLDALLWAREGTESDSLRSAIDQSLAWYVDGPEGLLAYLAASPQAATSLTAEDRIKSGAMLGILERIGTLTGQTERLNPILAAMRATLLVPERARQQGICAFPYDELGRKAITATAFAGLSYAELIRPGAAFR